MSIAGFYQEIGRLQQKVEDRDARAVADEEKIATLSLAHEQIHDQAVEYTIALRKAESENKKLMQRIQDNEMERRQLMRENEQLNIDLVKAQNEAKKLNREIAYINRQRIEQEATIKEAKDQLAKAQKTIKVQSDQIASKARTPQHQSSSASFQQVYNQSPPTWNPTSSKQPSIQGTPKTLQPPSSMRRQSSSIHRLPQDITRQAGTTSFNPQSIPSDGQMSMISTLTPNSFADGQMIGPTVHGSFRVPVLQVFTPFFDRVESWSRHYANLPDRERDISIPAEQQSQIKQYTDPDIAWKLLSSSSTRYLAIAKLINYMLVGYAFKPIIIKGFDKMQDHKISEYRDQLRKVGLAVHTRRALLVALAEIVKDITTSERWASFQEDSIRTQLEARWTLLRLLVAANVDRDQAWSELKRIWTEAFRIGISMLSKPSLFQFDFPPVGSNSHYNPSNMVSRETTFVPDPFTSTRVPATVRLSITPIVTEQDFVVNAPTPVIAHKANVLIDF